LIYEDFLEKDAEAEDFEKYTIVETVLIYDRNWRIFPQVKRDIYVSLSSILSLCTGLFLN